MKATAIQICFALAVVPAWAQGIQTEGNIETDGQLVSLVASGTAPLQVSSSSRVDNLNADLLDGRNWRTFALLTELEGAGVLLLSLLDNPAPPCFDNSHRFVDCLNGTVSDTATGLIWLKDAGCFVQQDYASANQQTAALADGSCDLSDGSRPGDWRLPTWQEWLDVLDSSCATAPKLVGNGSPTPECYSVSSWARDVMSSYYWASSAYSQSLSTMADLANFGSGSVGFALRTYDLGHVWPVRDGGR